MTDILENFAQSGLRFLPSEADEKRTGLMGILDKINSQHGRHTVRYAAEGLGEQVWHMNQNHRSPRRTTDWNELATVVLSGWGVR